MPIDVLQREMWTGDAKKLSDVFTMTKAGKSATCALWSHQFGWELRLTVGTEDLPRTQVCRSQEDVLSTTEQWKAAMTEKGWMI